MHALYYNLSLYARLRTLEYPHVCREVLGGRRYVISCHDYAITENDHARFRLPICFGGPVQARES